MWKYSSVCLAFNFGSFPNTLIGDQSSQRRCVRLSCQSTCVILNLGLFLEIVRREYAKMRHNCECKIKAWQTHQTRHIKTVQMVVCSNESNRLHKVFCKWMNNSRTHRSTAACWCLIDWPQCCGVATVSCWWQHSDAIRFILTRNVPLVRIFIFMLRVPTVAMSFA